MLKQVQHDRKGRNHRFWLQRFQRGLDAFRPDIKNHRFWITQGLVFLIIGIHDLIEIRGLLPLFGVLYFIPVSLLFIPLAYAALNFGLRGATATALWAAILMTPDWLVWHEGLQRLGVLFEMLILSAAALFVGYRVELETGARRQAESAGAALRISESKYRSLFQSSPTSILVIDDRGTILDANPAAGSLFGKRETLKGLALPDLVGEDNSRRILSSDGKARLQDLVLKSESGASACFQPVLFKVKGDAPNRSDNQLMLVLRDVTEERGRQIGLKAYAASVIHAQEEERKRIARELHDDVIQALILAYRKLDKVEPSIDPPVSPAIPGLEEARQGIEEAVGRLRGFATSLRPPALDDLGLVVSLRQLVLSSAENSVLQTEVRTQGEPRRLSPDTELGLFRIAQEALRNVERHAGASRVTLILSFSQNQVTLEVTDNGAGFPDTTDFAAAPHLGIIGMQERAELLGGRLDISSTPGGGTTIIATVMEPKKGQ